MVLFPRVGLESKYMRKEIRLRYICRVEVVNTTIYTLSKEQMFLRLSIVFIYVVNVQVNNNKHASFRLSIKGFNTLGYKYKMEIVE